IVNVPAGSQTVRVTYIGYRSYDQTVDVSAGGTATANFQLTQSAIGLDEIVVTGTAGQTEKRALGNSVGMVETEKLVAEGLEPGEARRQDALITAALDLIAEGGAQAATDIEQ
ncbi:MAG: carboxypeptidase-like regulatory domain-containing protein, partial [Desulfuromonadales bacterium]